MNSPPRIAAQRLTKAYRIWSEPSQRLLSPFFAGTARYLPGALAERLKVKATAGYRDFFALQDVSFEVKGGEAVGIIGRNGAGKSTLLQIIAGTLQPSGGGVRVNGRVAALLELGAGFNVDFTGRENVFLSGAVLGLGKTEIGSRFAEIAAFADIGEFMDEPVKTYSSGMMMRLAFAVSTCVDPDVLIVDEALSVGDAPFQAKCFRRLRQLIAKGVSLLFVSHDLGTVRSICSRALWLKNGRAEMWGDAKSVAKEYEKFCWAELGVQTGEARPAAAIPVETDENAAPLDQGWQRTQKLLQTHNHLLPVADESSRLGNRDVVLEAVVATNHQGEPATEFDFDEEVTLHYRLRASRAVDSEFLLGVRVRDVRGNYVYSVQDVQQLHRLRLAPGASRLARVRFRLPLTHGDYVLRTGIFGFKDGTAHEFGGYDFSRAIFWDIREDALTLRVRVCRAMPLAGPVHVHAPLETDQPA